MFGLSGFFNNIQNAFTKELFLRNSIKESIKKHTNLDFPIENILFKNGIVYIKKITTTELSVIYIKKTKILDEIKNKKVAVVTDIR